MHCVESGGRKYLVCNTAHPMPQHYQTPPGWLWIHELTAATRDNRGKVLGHRCLACHKEIPH